MPRDRAAYMREYRARKKLAVAEVVIPMRVADINSQLRRQAAEHEAAFWEVTAENERLAAEIAQLKRELAARPAPATYEVTTELSGGNVPRPFTEFRPVPKPGKGK